MRWTNSRSGRHDYRPPHRRRTTTSAARSTSNRSHRHAGTTDDRKTPQYAAAGNGGCAQDAGTGLGGKGAEFRRAPVLISGSAVELAREPGAGPPIEERKARP